MQDYLSEGGGGEEKVRGKLHSFSSKQIATDLSTDSNLQISLIFLEEKTVGRFLSG